MRVQEGIYPDENPLVREVCTDVACNVSTTLFKIQPSHDFGLRSWMGWYILFPDAVGRDAPAGRLYRGIYKM
jgi:hypothetical protein